MPINQWEEGALLHFSGGCSMRDGTFKKQSVSWPLFMAYGDDIGWFGYMRMVFRRTKQVGFLGFLCVFFYQKLCG